MLIQLFLVAILANKDSLFIVLGLDSISSVTSVPIILNISSPFAITYSEKYTDPNAFLTPNDSNNNNPNSTKTSQNESSSGLSAGAIAGIAVGAAAAVSLLTNCNDNM
jgi:hypothetical protein